MSTVASADSDLDLRYPIGGFQKPERITSELLREWIAQIERAPADLAGAVAGLTEQQLDAPYRPGGWTVRQLVHHVADSHMNSYVRYRLALTEDAPVIKPYDEARWAELPDARTAPIGLSLDLLRNLHARWAALLRSLRESDFQKTFVHPERGTVRLDVTTALYAWHGRHHAAHITNLRKRQGW